MGRITRYTMLHVKLASFKHYASGLLLPKYRLLSWAIVVLSKIAIGKKRAIKKHEKRCEVVAERSVFIIITLPQSRYAQNTGAERQVSAAPGSRSGA
jgi:hypothetical protein